MSRQKPFITASVAILFFGIASGSANADFNDLCGCNAGLAPELLQYSSNSVISLAFLRQIDEKQYEDIKRTGKASVDILDLVYGSAD